MTLPAGLGGDLRLTCATCFQSRLVPRDTQVEGIGLATRWSGLH